MMKPTGLLSTINLPRQHMTLQRSNELFQMEQR